MAGMNRSPGQAADGFHQFLATQLTGFRDGFSLHNIGEQRGAGHSGDASLGKKSNIFDAAIDDSKSKFQDVAAGRIVELDRRIRICDLAGVAWMLEVIEDFRGIHRRKLYRACVARAWPVDIVLLSQELTSKSTSMGSISGINQLTSF